ncbi:MAG: LLM class flavin-dependent oxidoreductase [Dehalococcoidia bacterium]|nr:LLM class flavin-dependent oxidoreductase [Dehalococcoidia bacterium]
MKFHWFAEVTYPHLPADFPQKHKSAWVDPPVSLMDPTKVGEMYRMFLRLMEQADREGFDGLAVNEHHQTAFAMSPSPNLLAASLAGTTENAAILVIGDSIALYNPPTRVAEEMAYLDCLSGGRLIAGFVFGTPMDSVFSYGTPPVELRERFHEARNLILRSWQEQEPFAHNGKYNKLRYVNVWPRPVQQPRPPVWVPGSGSIETWDLVIDENYCYGHLSFSGLGSAKPLVDGFWEYVDKRGGDMNPNRMAFTQICCVAETEEQAEKDYAEAVRYFYTHNPTSPAYVQPPGYHTQATLQAQMARGGGRLTNEDRMKAARGELSFWEYDEKGFIIAGTPKRVRERIRELATSLRVGQLIPTLHMGNLPEETAAKNTELFGREVIPYLRDLWADQPDHWTPQVSQQRVAANAPTPAGVGR